MPNILRYLFWLSTAILFLQGQDIRSLDEIKEQYRRIHDHLSSYTKQRIEMNDVSAEGTVAEIYRDDHGAVRLVNVSSFGEMGKGEEAYYYHNDKLFFLYAVTTQYNAPFYAEGQFDPKRSKVSRDRYYFVGGTMVRWVDNNHKQVSLTSTAFREKAREILNFEKRLHRLFSPHKARDVSRFRCREEETEGYVTAWIETFAADGAPLWKREIGKADPGALDILACLAMKGGGYVVAGDRTVGGTGESDFWIERLDARGDKRWQKHYPKFPQDRTVKVVKVSDGGFVATGFRDKEGSETHLWAMKLDASGKKVWEKYLGEAEPSDTITVTRSRTCAVKIVQKSDKERADKTRTICLQP